MAIRTTLIVGYPGETEADSPDVDNEVLIDASAYYLKVGEFVSVEISEAGDFDLYGVPQGVTPLEK
ncbi:MAG: hypothetical protein HQ499_01915 [Cryomorphaceae bacterium]|jgi:ribosomal protein S12 methylthiotransferase|nr:hypothetical protein [Cryomorphaceae bacterium]|tara:strand:- start:211 stop:408 length:198 start_codon:yes stop_codon:yes gene_type:complete